MRNTRVLLAVITSSNGQTVEALPIDKISRILQAVDFVTAAEH